jgi:hypothetical protein
VSEEERRYETGEKVELLDIVTVPLQKASPAGHQIENHILDDQYYWTKRGIATWTQIVAAADAYDASFGERCRAPFMARTTRLRRLMPP